ncbi:hypothetical protein [Aeromicrobium wangtongii]|uniref:Uncharacterized protein n=1 Tax=Aeromicrobium wangtongii TaxID=2969247 RepID=A0ABY5M924_9ACTN|nr:hypothetical protein [Aeromicrobium wangtongii]MCD9199901.1 hypothetical protein [Aeromicrobium wangtongii]UUP13518.1 hypothetical protein NQV15_16965 [Aeromicrobium wangtongii]
MNRPVSTDDLARTILGVLWETTDRQVSREIAHLADIAVDTADDGSHVAPEGLLMPESGCITTHVTATARDHPGVSEDMRVAVWPVADGGQDPAFVVTRSDSDLTLPVALADVQPDVTPRLRARANDFVAAIIAHMVAELDVKMQRTYIRESQGDLAEYTED